LRDVREYGLHRMQRQYASTTDLGPGKRMPEMVNAGAAVTPLRSAASIPTASLFVQPVVPATQATSTFAPLSHYTAQRPHLSVLSPSGHPLSRREPLPPSLTWVDRNKQAPHVTDILFPFPRQRAICYSAPCLRAHTRVAISSTDR
jgi:hypothetical protein